MNAPTNQQQDFDVGTLYAGRYLKADDLGGKTYTATIAAIEQMEFPRPGGGVQAKAVLTLQGWPAQLVLNKTNYEVLAAAYGRQAAGWIGKRIEVYPDTTLFGGRSVPCVRVRVPRPAAPMAAVPGMAPAAPAASGMVVPNAAPAQAPTGQAEQLPPLMTAGELTDDIPY